MLEPEHAGKRGKGVRQQLGHPLEASQVTRAAVDRRPGEHLIEHRLSAGALDRLAFGGRQLPHGSGSSQRL
jgi:hypothetical protein